MLTAAVLVSALLLDVRPGRAAGTVGQQRPLLAVVTDDPVPVPAVRSLVRVDPTTLQEIGPRLVLESGAPWQWAYSPDGRELANYVYSDQLQFVDLETMTVRATLSGYFGGGITWLSPHRLIALSSNRGSGAVSEMFAIDPRVPRIVSRFQTSKWGVYPSIGRFRTRVAVLTSKGLGSRYRIAFSGPGDRFREVELKRLVPDFDQWNGQAAGELGPRAASALAQSRADLSAREDIPPSEIVEVAVFPKSWGQGWGGCGRGFISTEGHQVILRAREQEYDYRVVLDNPPALCTGSTEARPPERNLLRVGPNASHVTSTEIGVDRGRARAFVFAPGAPVAQLDLSTNRVRYRKRLHGFRRNGWIADIASMGDGKVVVRLDGGTWPSEVGLIDTRSWRYRPVPGASCRFVAGSGLIFTYCPWARDGLSVYRPNTRAPILRRFLGQTVQRITVVGPYAYVRTAEEPRFRYVIGLPSGQVVNRVEFAGSLLEDLVEAR